MYAGLPTLPHVGSIFQQVVFVYEPEGIDGSANTNFTPGLAKSASGCYAFGVALSYYHFKAVCGEIHVIVVV